TRLTQLISREELQVVRSDHVAVPSRHHFVVRRKRQHRKRFQRISIDDQRRFIADEMRHGPDATPFETDRRERLVQFLREFGRRTFGSSGTLESLTLLEDTSESKRSARYLVIFANGARMIW